MLEFKIDYNKSYDENVADAVTFGSICGTGFLPESLSVDKVERWCKCACIRMIADDVRNELSRRYPDAIVMLARDGGSVWITVNEVHIRIPVVKFEEYIGVWFEKVFLCDDTLKDGSCRAVYLMDICGEWDSFWELICAYISTSI